MTTRVIIVRHGQSTYNAQQMIQGRCDESVLTEKGCNDARIVGETLANLKFDAIYHSPLQRAAQTAEIIHRCLDNPPALTASSLLLEIDLPLWEKLNKKDAATQHADAYRKWKNLPHEFSMTLEAGEYFPVLSLYKQAQEFWQEMLARHQGETVLIVAHNGINRCLLMSAIGIPVERYHTIQQSNCCINVLNFSGSLGDSVQLESLNQTAHMGVKIPPPRPPQTKVRLLLVRHGETQWNRESRFQGTIDVPLNERGREQAQKAAEFLQDVGFNFALSSPMARPKETAEIILSRHPEVTLALEPQFEEIGHGLWEGKLETEIEAAFPGLLHQWKIHPETVQMPEGENLQQVWDRAIAAWNNIVKTLSESEESTVGLVVAHDAINKVLLCYLLGLQPADIWTIKQGNGAVSVIDYPSGTEGLPVLQAINITSHLGGILDNTAAGAL
ncbi:histidine phosphatase family protein [Oscillatoria sp. FACHB-1406]|uniref:histidine phosphatase family protein n=1 Tax=Oscillatoria sp. FACHB-1406 TaxID=2692846 RepID=UPI00168353F8|nr:histidine phosphatase family protein [Oscillatoria sp. FACHB-1406]MBD2580263.1 histidine phosphatase family protein [Oscillatoria sp. FACHB-1406]